MLRDHSLEDKVEYWTANTLDSSTSGSVYFRNGSIRLPDYLNVTEFNQLRARRINRLLKDKFGLQIDDPDVWSGEEGTTIINSFLLSDRAKKFLIARDLHPIESADVWAKTTIISLAAYLAMLLQSKHEQKLRTMAGKKVRPVLFGSQRPVAQFWAFSIPLAIVFAYGLYLTWGVEMHRDADAMALSRGKKDALAITKLTFEEAKLLDGDYYLGALEFYEKVLERNKAVRSLLKRQNKKVGWWSYLNLDQIRENGGENNVHISNQLPSDVRLKNIQKWERS